MRSGPITNARILVVDDQETNVVLLRTLLAQAGYTDVRGITDPRAAVATFWEFAPDLVLLDLLMPHLDGFGVMAQLRPLLPARSFLPILVLTAEITAEVKRRALAEGATDFLSKPLDTLEVLLLRAQGQTNKEIASVLVLSPTTVKFHVEHIIAKLAVADRTQAAVRAVELGLLADPSRP